jgi:hypothetical protein
MEESVRIEERGREGDRESMERRNRVWNRETDRGGK